MQKGFLALINPKFHFGSISITSLTIIITQRSLHSTQFVIMNLLMISNLCFSDETSKILCTNKEKQALLKFKQGLIDDSEVLSSWETEKDCCKWRGITCNDRTGLVIELDLSYNIFDSFSSSQPLTGEIRTSLHKLQNLEYLDLSFNAFNGVDFPSFFGSFVALKHLKLSSNGFRGAISQNLGNLSNLQTLDLSRNADLTVNDLDWLSRLSFLKYLNLSQLNLSKIITWSQHMNQLHSLSELQLSSCNLPDINLSSLRSINVTRSLRVLDLSYNHLNSSVFFWVSKIGDNLVQIGLSGCEMQGQIPDVFTKIPLLVSLDLSYNHLEGGFPKSFRNLCHLESLNLFENRLTDRLYDSMKSLSCSENTLKHLSLSGNPFSGPLPDLSRFSSLVELYLDVTNITGPLPRNLRQFSKLDSLSLAFNKLTGPLPDFTGLSSLRMLFLIGNHLNGSVPSSLGQLLKLEYLDLSSNSLEGVLTESHFSNLSRLRSLSFAQNPNLSLSLSPDWIPPFQLNTLDMSSCSVGPAFPRWLQTQVNLSSLYLSDARISDSIPAQFWDLSTSLITLNLSLNQIHGKLPDMSSPNYTFSSLDLSSNNFDGPIPLIPQTISHLILSNNMFSGSLSSLCKLQSPSVFHLDLSENLLSGELPDCWIKFQQLLFLNLAKNNFSGEIPISISSLRSIMLLRLHENRFTGEMPSLENCTELRVVDFGRNKFSGKIPPFGGKNLPKLLVLRLRFNELTGEFPSSLCTVQTLHVLDFSHNHLAGTLPQCLNNITALSYDVTDNIILGFVQVVWKGIEREFGNNLKHLRSIDFSSNAFNGKIPKTVTNLLKLVSLNLSRNDLVGQIPNNFGELSSLESLDLSRNRLSGSIPASFASLRFLSYLDLSYNDLTGKIPASTQLQSFDASSYTGNLDLCGLPIEKECLDEDEDSGVSDSNGSEEDDDGDGIVSTGFYVGIGVGFFVGFWGICGGLLFNSSWRSSCFMQFDQIKECSYKRTRVLFNRLSFNTGK